MVKVPVCRELKRNTNEKDFILDVVRKLAAGDDFM